MMSSTHNLKLHTCGTVAPGYELVRTLFEQHLSDGIEDRAQCCVYVKGIKVVDLWGTSPHTPKQERETIKYDGGSIQNVFSSTKVLTSLVIAMLVDRGRLKYEQKVMDIWPEYGQKGKESTTVVQVMRHEAGLFRFEASLKATDLTAARIKEGAVSDTIAAEFPEHVPGEKRVYHTMTRGWIVNEIVRRADVKKRTIGEFLQDEIGIPLGIENELLIGTPDHLHAKIARLKDVSVWWSWVQLLLPRGLGGGAVPVQSLVIRLFLIFGIPYYRFLKSTGLVKIMFPLLRWLEQWWWERRSGVSAKSKIESKNPLELPEFPNHKSFPWITKSFNTPSVRRAEIPSANGHCSARAMAKVAASIVEGGVLKDCPRILSKEGVKMAHGNPVRKVMFGLFNSPFTNAGWNMFQEKNKKGRPGRDGFIGWMGLGGSVMQWHPTLRIGFGYAMNMLEITPSNERGRVLQEAAVLCAKGIEESRL